MNKLRPHSLTLLLLYGLSILPHISLSMDVPSVINRIRRDSGHPEPQEHVRHFGRKEAEASWNLLKPESDENNGDHSLETLRQLSKAMPTMNRVNRKAMLNPNETKLMMMLDEHGGFDRDFVSLYTPQEHEEFPDGTLQYSLRENRMPRSRDLPAEFQAIFKREIQISDDGPVLTVKFDKKTRRKLQKFLWTYTFCPVRHRWQDMGKRFWPRWVKTGSCDNQRSCSIPAGMTCSQSKLKTLNFLMYIEDFGWRPYKSAVTVSECKCGCDS